MQEGEPRIVNYDLSENELWSLGIGCKGTWKSPFSPFVPKTHFGNLCGRPSPKTVPSHSLSNCLPVLVPSLTGQARFPVRLTTCQKPSYSSLTSRVWSRTRAEVAMVDGRRFYIDTMRPSERLILCGAGHDAVPVAALAAKCGFRVTVLDPRKEFNGPKRFPTTEHLVVEPDQADPAQLKESWWLIMNHLQVRDEAALHLALQAQPKFIGVLGPLSRTREMLNNIGADMDSGPIHAPSWAGSGCGNHRRSRGFHRV